jgi:hypothetical protein
MWFFFYSLLDKVSSSNITPDSRCVDWAKQAAHRCLVYLGDLSRYFLDLYPRWNSGLAARYYLQVSVHDIYYRKIPWSWRFLLIVFWTKYVNCEAQLHCFSLSDGRRVCLIVHYAITISILLCAFSAHSHSSSIFWMEVSTLVNGAAKYWLGQNVN